VNHDSHTQGGRSGHIQLMAHYNQWMNAKLYAVALALPPDQLNADRKAFFGSIAGTLNHLLVGDTIWLQRFAAHPASYAALDPVRRLPAPASLDQILFEHIDALWQRRQLLDQVIVDWAKVIDEADLDIVLTYTNSRAIVGHRHFFSLLMHFFNHQTHHRGQVSTLLSQAGCPLDVTDLLVLIADQELRS
jgi:uncharacterized damage-inducible protein DinB